MRLLAVLIAAMAWLLRLRQRKKDRIVHKLNGLDALKKGIYFYPLFHALRVGPEMTFAKN